MSFAAGEMSKAVAIDILGDNDIIEADETIALSLGGFSNGGAAGTTSTATLTITNDDGIVTNTNDTGDGSLRQAIIAANNVNSIASPTITLDGASGTITLASALPDITRDLTIDGPGSGNLTISGNNSVRVFSVMTGINATFEGLTISNGTANQGGGIFNDGGIVTVENAVLSNNTATTFNAVSQIIGGAGIASRNGDLTVTNTQITGSLGGASGQGISFAVSTGTHSLTVTDSTLSGGKNDAILLGLSGASTTTVSITGNTISGNGQANL